MDLALLNDANIDQFLRKDRNIHSKTIEEKRYPHLEQSTQAAGSIPLTSEAMGTIVSGATKVMSQNKMSSFFDESQMARS